MMFGAAQGLRDFIEITIGTGLGSGIVSNGQLILGHDGFAGEIGHTIAIRNGRMCTCGRAGCLETYVSARGLLQTVRKLAPAYSESILLADGQIPELSAKQVQVAAQQGDALALAAYRQTGQILGQTLADSVAYTSPSTIILFGGVAKASEFLIPATQKAMDDNLLPIYKGKVQVVPSALNDRNAAVLGAAALVWNHLQSQGNEH
jgi:glucokinase